MTRQFDLAEYLQPVLPKHWKVSGDLPFRFEQNGKPVEWETEAVNSSESKVSVSLTGDNLRLKAEWKILAAHQAATLDLELENTSDTPSQPFNLIQPLHLQWSTDELPIYIRNIGGGLNEHNYPPQTFRVETIRSDGGGFYWMENGHDGRSSNDKSPLLQICSNTGGVVAALEWSGLW